MYVLMIVLLWTSVALAQGVSITSPIFIDTPVAAKIRWATREPIRINTDTKTLTIYYEYLDADNGPIRNSRFQSINTWTCADVPDANLSCTEPGTPNAWCTGAGTGTFDDNCFSEVFGFTMRQQDVGKKIGFGFRKLIMNKFCPAVAPNNTCAFEDGD